ncbi:phage tail assembly protein [Acidocella sp.]|uniref:phage tail assembly protein n=1 Tax=Acidocella sp. TaxID=50710 RepID=UPI0026054002|nr:phage tail assembly protein [Acidocella sp.]
MTIRERTRTVELPAVISLAGKDYYTLDLRVPKIGELKRAQTHFKGTADSATAMQIALVSIVTGMPIPAVEQIDIDIAAEAAEWLLGFMPKPLKEEATLDA